MMITEKPVFYPDPGVQPRQTRRSPSPFLKREKGHIKMITKNKMPRIRLRDAFYGHIIEASSPSAVWIRIHNHITPHLELPKGADLSSVKEISTGDYAMAKVSKYAFGRCRVMETDYNTRLYLVRFIDHGGEARLPLDELFELPKKLWTYPWQTIPVVLFGADPIDGKCWSEDEVVRFVETYQQFELFWIFPASTLLQYVNDDSYYCRVNMFGIPNPVKQQLSIRGGFNGIDIRNVFLASRGTFDDATFRFGEEQEEFDAVTL